MSGSGFDPLLLLPIAALSLWWHGRRVHERAVGHAREACRRHGLELLDHTVVLERRRIHRRPGKLPALERRFGFECSGDGRHRDRGSVRMRGIRLVAVEFPYLRDADGNRVFHH